MSGAMAAAAATASAARPVTVSPTYSSRKQTYALASSVPVLSYRNPKFHICSSASLVGFGRLPVWSGLKHLGISLRRSTKEAKCKCRGKVVYASLFGVGAPEALVIGVVALLVFGPKGLAEVARNLGKTLRAFQPTIRELQDVSREFKSTLEREIGLDEVQPTLRSTDNLSTSVNEKPKTVADPNGFQANNTPYSSEELLNVTQQQLASTDSEELPKGAVAYQDASTDSTTSPESESEAAASDKVAIENATPDVYSTPATPESNASTTATEPRAAASEMAPTANVSVTNQESQT